MKKLSLFIIRSSLLILAQASYAVELETDEQKLSYAIGVYFSQNIAEQHENLHKEGFIQAVNDVLDQRTLKLTQEEIRDAFVKYKQQQQMKIEKNKIIGEEFLSENEKKEGVIKLASGLQYKVLREGSGEKAEASSKVSVHYRGTLVDGREFDSSYARGQPATFQLNQVIKGWTEALQLMKTGAKWQIYLPYSLAYGEQGAGGIIGPYSTLIFEVELLEVH